MMEKSSTKWPFIMETFFKIQSFLFAIYIPYARYNSGEHTVSEFNGGIRPDWIGGFSKTGTFIFSCSHYLTS